ncbi:MAG: hypothetical protein K9N35_05115 [Candidatus Marinimicrobia bacterium]|nr:hypothetical protein [Candidatus Neomarinimicrobiota bacterium]
MRIHPSRLALLVLLPFTLLGQLNISGEVSPSAMIRISDGSIIDLPFRPFSLSVDYALGDFELKTTTAIETRWKDPEFSSDMIQFREAYLEWYPSFGEVKLGKMIHAWGAADANNPTDNLSPYDYYYMFLTGTDRKIGTLSMSGKAYLGDAQLELIAIPEFESNRFPLNEPDFPINIPIPDGAQYFYPENEFEFGARLRYAMGLGDISASYFKGNDRSFSPAGVEIDLSPTFQGLPPSFMSHLTYRSTDVMGLDAVLFPGDWTLRGEFAYFRTKTPDIDHGMSKFTYDAQYLQSVLQVEYSFANSVQLMGQFISNKYIDTESEFVKDNNFLALENMLQNTSDPSLDPLRTMLSSFTIPEFSAGMGTPFAMIADKVVMLSSMATILDNDLEIRGMLMVNLDETGYMLNAGGEYTIKEGLSFDATLGYFIGGDEDGNRFKELEDFSNVTLTMKYSF